MWLEVEAGRESDEMSEVWGVRFGCISPIPQTLHWHIRVAHEEKGEEDEGEKVIKKNRGGTHRPIIKVCPALKSMDNSMC